VSERRDEPEAELEEAERSWCVWAVLRGVDGTVRLSFESEAAAREVFDLTRAKLDADREVVAYGLASPESEVAPGTANTLARLKGRRAEIGVAEIRRTAAFMTRMGWRTPVEGEDEGR